MNAADCAVARVRRRIRLNACQAARVDQRAPGNRAQPAAGVVAPGKRASRGYPDRRLKPGRVVLCPGRLLRWVLEWAYGRRDWRKDGERRRHVMALPMLTLRHSATLVSPSAGDRLVNFSVGTDDELEALWCADQDWDALFGRGLDWPRKVRSGRTFRPVDVRLTIHGSRETVVRTIESLFLSVR